MCLQLPNTTDHQEIGSEGTLDQVEEFIFPASSVSEDNGGGAQWRLNCIYYLHKITISVNMLTVTAVIQEELLNSTQPWQDTSNEMVV